MRGRPIESSFSPTRPAPISRSLALVNLVTCLISIIFECFQYIFQVFSMRASRERDQVYCFIVSACFQWARMRAGYANRKRCIIVDADTVRLKSLGALNEIFLFYVFIYFFSMSALPFCALTLREGSPTPPPPPRFSQDIRRRFCDDELRSWNTRCRTGFDEGPLLKNEHTRIRIPIAGYNIYRH